MPCFPNREDQKWASIKKKFRRAFKLPRRMSLRNIGRLRNLSASSDHLGIILIFDSLIISLKLIVTPPEINIVWFISWIIATPSLLFFLQVRVQKNNKPTNCLCKMFLSPRYSHNKPTWYSLKEVVKRKSHLVLTTYNDQRNLWHFSIPNFVLSW